MGLCHLCIGGPPRDLEIEWADRSEASLLCLYLGHFCPGIPLVSELLNYLRMLSGEVMCLNPVFLEIKKEPTLLVAIVDQLLVALTNGAITAPIPIDF